MKTESRVFVRPLAAKDSEAFIAAVRRSRVLHRSWVTPKARTPREFAEYLRRFSAGLNYGFVVVHQQSGALVGVININNVVRGAFQSGALGYFAFAPYAGQGLMHQGMLLVLRHAFTKLKLHRLEANIQPGNDASVALVRKCGFAFEGFSPRMLKVAGRWRDHERWTLLTEDFKSKPGKTKYTFPQ